MARLETIRRQRLLSQRDLAERARVAKSTIYLIEAGKTKPRLIVMRHICEALGVEPMEVDEFRVLLEEKPPAQEVA